MSGAIPEKLMVKQAMLSDSNMVRKTVELYAASANSQTNYSSGDRLLFSIPAYAHSFIDFSKIVHEICWKNHQLFQCGSRQGSVL